MQNEINYLDYLYLLKKHLKLIFVITIGTFLIAAFFALKSPNQYQAVTTFYYPLGQKGTGSLNALAESALGKGGSDLMSSLFSSEPANLQNYTKGILGSRKIAEIMIADMNLKNRLGIQNEETLIRIIHGISAIKLSNEGIMEIDVTTSDPKLSADLANGFVGAFREFTLTSMISVSQKHRRDVEIRLAQLKVSLDNAERDMVNFQKNYKTADFTLESKAMMGSLSSLHAEALAAELALRTLRGANSREKVVANAQLRAASADPLLSPGLETSVISDLRQQFGEIYTRYSQAKIIETPNNPDLQSLSKQVENLKRNLRDEIRREMASNERGITQNGYDTRLRIAQLEAKHQAILKGIAETEKKFLTYPTIGLAYLQKSRQLKVLETLYTMLSSAYEQAKLEEAKESPDFQVLDRAVVPDQKIGPHRMRSMMLGLLLGILLGISAAFFYETMEKVPGALRVSKDGHPRRSEEILVKR